MLKGISDFFKKRNRKRKRKIEVKVVIHQKRSVEEKRKNKKNVEKKKWKRKKVVRWNVPQVNDFLMIPNVLIHS